MFTSLSSKRLADARCRPAPAHRRIHSMDLRSPSAPAVLTPETLVLLNRATLVMHTVRTAIHEVNNVLQMISGSAEMLAGTPGLQPQAATRIDTILQSALRGHTV